jgi:hypothetical protein
MRGLVGVQALACVFQPEGCTPARRRGVASLDYVLVLGVVLPLVVFIMYAGPRMMRLAYEMLCVLVSWPFV